jgi:hypothetical protein
MMNDFVADSVISVDPAGSVVASPASPALAVATLATHPNRNPRERAWTPPIAILPAILARADGQATRFAMPVEGLRQDDNHPSRWILHPGNRYAPSLYHARWSHTNGRREEIRDTETHQLISERSYFKPRDEWLAGICPLGRPGDRLRVRESWQTHEDPATMIDGILYKIDNAFRPIENAMDAAEAWGIANCYSKMAKATKKANPHAFDPGVSKRPGSATLISLPQRPAGWRSSTSMPPWASRLTLTIASVSVGPLHAMVETSPQSYFAGPDPLSILSDFIAHWDTSYGKYAHQKATTAWEANPLAWSLELVTE